MATKAKCNGDPGMGTAAALKELVAVAVGLQALDRTIEELRHRIEAGADNKAIRYAVLAATLDASEFIGRLVKLEIAVESDGEA